MSLAASATDRLIRVYQRRISPRKGYSCAHRVAHGGTSCSEAIRRTVVARGVLRGLRPTAARFVACYQAAGMLAQSDVRGVCCCGGIPIPFRF
ncbi:membrane protein insertion efficiency factor YidD [Cellulosimicrobium cellulans]|uniref:membrane protein insertion efficiency factor YidD n=1 Tax=Cellulosimicrobium cellulans TaxID=1710 RepID=UPI00130D7C07|nr:membrane protein insertion efficiency factor YidD [Cellulosimicrobium cellulans]